MHRVESRSSHLEQAEKLIQDSIRLGAKDFMTYRTLSMLYFLKKQYHQAIIEAKKAIELNPNSAQSFYMCGKLLYVWNGIGIKRQR